jgi:hypothetical protein
MSEPINRTKLFIATPAYGHQVTTVYANSVFKFMATNPPKDLPYNTIIHLQSGMALVTQARNNCVAEFMKSKSDVLFFIDSDIGFQPEFVHKLLKRVLETKGVALCPYPVKGYQNNGTGITFIIHFPDKTNIQVDKEGFCEIKAGPTGFMMIHREVFEKLAKAYPEKKTINKQMIGNSVVTLDEFWYTFFETAVHPVNGYLGEDIAFCDLCKKIGIPIHGDVKSDLIHYGGHSFRGSLDMSFKNEKLKDFVKEVDELPKNK